MSEPWRPSASVEALRARDHLLKNIRAFFAARDFVEVDVPVLSRAGSTDPHLHSFQSTYFKNTASSPHNSDAGEPLYLQTSPEFFMKRLLAAGSGPIYSLSKAFRQGESGRFHNPEFTLLEWYQPDFDDRQLVAQVADLLLTLLPRQQLHYFSYRELFHSHFRIDPHTACTDELRELARAHFSVNWDDNNPTTWLDFLFSLGIQPTLSGISFVCDYPAAQAALAKIVPDAQGVPVAKRFEVFIDGVELGNGYWELTDAEEQAARFAEDNQARHALGLPNVAIDQHLLSALRHGMPEAAGIALGVDRLLMAMMGVDTIDQVLCFPVDRV